MSEHRVEEARRLTLQRAFEEAAEKWRHASRGCPLDEDLAAYSKGILPPSRRLAVQRHLRGCALCRADLASLREALTPTAVIAGAALREHSWFRSLAGAEAVVLLLVGGFLLVREGYHRGRYLEHHAQLRLEVQATIADGFRDVTRLMTLLARAQTDQVAAAIQGLQVVPAIVGGRTYPYPMLRTDRIIPTMVIADGGGSASPLKTEYDAYMRQWGEVLRMLGDTLVRAGKIPEAIRVFEYLRDASPEASTPEDQATLLGFMYALGELYKANGDHPAALALYDTIMARQLAAQDPRPAHYGGWSAYQMKQYEVALWYYDEALRIDPGYAKVWYNKALALRALGQEGLAQEHMDKALTLTLQAYHREGDAQPRITFTLGILYATRGDLDEALHYLEQALRRDPLYVIRAEREYAFSAFHNQTNVPYEARFQALLNRYKPPQGQFGARAETYDPSSFNE